MRKLKSLTEFQDSTSLIDSNQLKNIKGGGIRYWWVVTTRVAGDRDEMAQQGTWVGGQWHWTSPAYTTGKTMVISM